MCARRATGCPPRAAPPRLSFTSCLGNTRRTGGRPSRGTGAVPAGAWTAAVLVIHAVIVSKCRQFLDQPVAEISARAWRLRFIMLDLFYGLAWMFILIHPIGG